MRRTGAGAERHEHRRAASGPAATTRQAASAGAAVPPPLTADALRAAQRGAGNAAVTTMIARRFRPVPVAPEVPDPEVHKLLRSGGERLRNPVREDMESRFDDDFSDVRLHTGAAAARSARALGARAYTSGNHVVIGDGGGDRHTLAHELTHVVQQRQGPVAGTDHGGGLRISDPSDRFERAAEANARRVLSGPAPVRRAPEPDTGRQPAPSGAGAVQRMYSGGEEDEEDYLGDDESDIAEGLEEGDALAQLVADVNACTCEPRLQQEGRSTKEAMVSFPRDQKAERAEQTMRHISIRLFNCIRYLHDVALQNARDEAASLDPDGDSAMAESSTAPEKKSKDTKGKGKAAAKKKGPPRESEVQGLLINERLVFATNRNRSVTLLMEYLKAQSAGQDEGAPAPDLTHLMNHEPSEKELRTGRSTREADDLIAVNRRARLKIKQVYKGERASATADAMRRRGPVVQLEAAPTTEEGIAELRRILTADEYRGAVILLKHSTGTGNNPDGKESVHAEQKLMLALNTAELSEEQLGEKIVVRGTKRPCKACWALLEHYRQRGFPLSFNNRPGAFFKESARTGLEEHPQIAAPPGGQGEGNWMSQQITAKARLGTHVSAYSGERAPDEAETGSDGGKRLRVTAKEVRTKDDRVAYTHAEHGTGGHETLSDSDVIEESDGSLTSTLAKLDLSGIRGVTSGDSESEAAAVHRGKKRKKKNLAEHPDLLRQFEDAMGADFRATVEQRKQGPKSGAGMHYPQPLMDLAARLRDEEDVSMNSMAGHLGVDTGAFTRTVESRTTGNEVEDTDGPSAPKKKKKSPLGGPLDQAGENRLLGALTPEFARWRTTTLGGGNAGKRPAFGAALEDVMRGMKGTYSAKSIGVFLGKVPDKTIRNYMKDE
ncbi:DUF4157 domain-containing protein [Streptomyces sp. NPDC005840]|uniref:eCIS core domain-containing protein n=1 Tax=Streptomyces sp. NPDC005840 TaxID=3157072 RepID=UPI00340CD6B7